MSFLVPTTPLVSVIGVAVLAALSDSVCTAAMAVWSVNPRAWSDTVNKDVICREEAVRTKTARIKFELLHGVDYLGEKYMSEKYGEAVVQAATQRNVSPPDAHQRS